MEIVKRCLLLLQDVHAGGGAGPGPGLPRGREPQRGGQGAALRGPEGAATLLPGPHCVRPLLVRALHIPRQGVRLDKHSGKRLPSENYIAEA